MALNVNDHATPVADGLYTTRQYTLILVDYLAMRLAIPAESIDVDQAVFGVEGAAIGPVILDSMELVELLVELEARLGTPILTHFDAFAELSISAIAAKIATTPRVAAPEPPQVDSGWSAASSEGGERS